MTRQEEQRYKKRIAKLLKENEQLKTEAVRPEVYEHEQAIRDGIKGLLYASMTGNTSINRKLKAHGVDIAKALNDFMATLTNTRILGN